MMGFTKENIDKEKMESLLQGWQSRFSRKKSSAVAKNAASIAQQMMDSLSERHGYLFLAKDETDGTPRALLIADDHAKEMVIRFVLADVISPDAKGAGRFLVQEMVNLSERRSCPIRTTSQNADAFWKKFPGFMPDKANPTDFIFQPGGPVEKLAIAASSQPTFFREKSSAKSKGRKAHSHAETSTPASSSSSSSHPTLFQAQRPRKSEGRKEPSHDVPKSTR